jgi:hypothetical protein
MSPLGKEVISIVNHQPRRQEAEGKRRKVEGGILDFGFWIGKTEGSRQETGVVIGDG